MTDDLRKIERVIYNNTIVVKDIFPTLSVDESELLESEILSFDFSTYNFCCMYVRFFGNSWFVDIYYIWSDDNDVIRTDRLVMAPGYQMSEEDEDILFRKYDDWFVLYRTEAYEQLVLEINRVAPELHLVAYDNPAVALIHIYFASHRSGMRELLFKAGLDYIALNLSKVDGFNILSANIEEAFGIPVKMLRKLNHPGGIGALATEERRKLVGTVYRRLNSIMNTGGYDKMNFYQIRYLYNYMTEEGSAVDRRIMRAMGYLSQIEGWDSEEERYVDGDVLCKELIDRQEGYANIFPWYLSLAGKNPEAFWKIFADISCCIDNKQKIDARMQFLSERWRRCYQYNDDKYVIVVPMTIDDIMQESAHQHNCLCSMYKDILNEISTVLFLRKKETPKQSLVTVEISGGQISQAKGVLNSEITDEQSESLKAFALQKGLEWAV